MARAHLVKASADDVELLYPGVSLGEVAAEWLQRGAAVVVITCGGRGTQGFTRRAQVRIDAAAVELVDSVGAGDSFQAAWLAWLADNGALPIAAPICRGAVSWPGGWRACAYRSHDAALDVTFVKGTNFCGAQARVRTTGA